MISFSGHPEIESSFVQDKFNCLVNTHFLQRCTMEGGSEENSTEDLFKLPELGSITHIQCMRGWTG